MRKKPWSARELEENPRVLDFGGRADFEKIDVSLFFNAAAPVHLEAGCGKGRFLSRMAQAHPEINFIGVERGRDVLAAAARLSRQLERPPLFICADVSSLDEIFCAGQIERLYINFCDPWPNKKKWAKRRLTHDIFLEVYEKLDIREIFFKTDNLPLFEFSAERLAARGWTVAEAGAYDPYSPGNIMTEYEEKFASQGLPVYRITARREGEGSHRELR